MAFGSAAARSCAAPIPRNHLSGQPEIRAAGTSTGRHPRVAPAVALGEVLVDRLVDPDRAGLDPAGRWDRSGARERAAGPARGVPGAGGSRQEGERAACGQEAAPAAAVPAAAVPAAAAPAAAVPVGEVGPADGVRRHRGADRVARVAAGGQLAPVAQADRAAGCPEAAEAGQAGDPAPDESQTLSRPPARIRSESATWGLRRINSSSRRPELRA
jgi:hypothetical protein